jgi:hypothetical protein
MFASKDTLLTRPSGGYTIARSVRLRKSASGYLNRNPASNGTRTTWTYSTWVKRGQLGAGAIIHAQDAGNTVSSEFNFASDDTIYFREYGGSSYTGYLQTTQVFRDPSAWYHLVLVWDSNNGTSGDKIRLYVNGTRITAFSTATYPSSSTTTVWNSTGLNRIGFPSTSTMDGYLTEINFIDGQALTPSSFGETDSITGVWKPKAYSGTYGTNGFELNFSDNSNNTATTIGKDYSGNGNNWTPNNISVTTGATYDSMVDSPTVGATSSNYAVINPIGVRSGGNTLSVISDGNLKALNNTGSAQEHFGTMVVTSGKYYWEATVQGSPSGQQNYTGVYTTAPESSFAAIMYSANGDRYQGGWLGASWATYTSGDVIGIALDVTTGSATFYKNNTSQGSLTFTAGSPCRMWGLTTTNGSGYCYNHGQQPFSYTPPTGFVALNTYNLPASTITNGAAYMAATTYTGTGASLTVANTVGSASFQPDWVWVKSRSAATDHALYDSVRGVQKQIESNTTTAETTETTGLTAFGSTGFTTGALAQMNTSAATYVAWQWKAGTTSASNTNGSITSTVSVGATQGFSVVTYTGTGTAATIGHGLGVAPSMYLVKSRSLAGENWIVYHTSLGNAQQLNLNTTAAQAASTNFNSTSPTSSVFSIGSGTAVNSNTNTYVAYCFAAVKGFSAFGSYTGNGSADGPFIYTGFRPRWVMTKRTDSTGSWLIVDSSRNTYNVVNGYLVPNTSDAEGSATWGDFLSNGFKLRGTTHNGSGESYVYACFAENPFKNSLAR